MPHALREHTKLRYTYACKSRDLKLSQSSWLGLPLRSLCCAIHPLSRLHGALLRKPRNFILLTSSNFILLHPGTQHHRVTPPIVRLTLTPLALTSPQGQVSLAGLPRRYIKKKKEAHLAARSKKAPAACFAKSSGHVFNRPRREIEPKESVLGSDWTWKLLMASLATTVDNTIKMADTVRKHGCEWCIRSIQARYLFNDAIVFENGWGAFYIDERSIGIWRPICFAQMYALPTTADRQTIEVQLQTKSSTVTINGGGLMAAAFPPPAFLSSIRALSALGSSNQSPYSNLVHTIKVHTNKALLIMAANGRITGRGLDHASLTYTIDGVSPVDGRSKNFGHYFVSSASTGNYFIPMGLYQLAEVSRGTHTVQLEGSGSPFDLNYVTSQITTIPISDVQLRTVTADWEIETPKQSPKSLIAAEFTTKSDSVLVLSSTFRVHGSCQRAVYHQFNVDGERLYASIHHTAHHQLNTWFDAPGETFFRVPVPGSLFAFAQVGKGRHRVELMTYNQGPCPITTIGAALQVGVVPDEY